MKPLAWILGGLLLLCLGTAIARYASPIAKDNPVSPPAGSPELTNLKCENVSLAKFVQQVAPQLGISYALDAKVAAHGPITVWRDQPLTREELFHIFKR